MVGGPSYDALQQGLRESLEAFLRSEKTAEDMANLMLAGVNYWPRYKSGNGSHPVQGVKKSDIYIIMDELGIPGDYEKLITNTSAYEDELEHNSQW